MMPQSNVEAEAPLLLLSEVKSLQLQRLFKHSYSHKHKSPRLMLMVKVKKLSVGFCRLQSRNLHQTWFRGVEV